MGKLDETNISSLLSRLDGWNNLATGLGLVGRDKAMSSSFAPTRELLQWEVEDLYRGDGIAQRLVDVLPSDAVRQGFEIRISPEMENGGQLEPADVNTLESDIQMELRRLGTSTKLKRALRWDQLYGGSVIVMIIDDGRKSEEPVDTNNIKRINAIYTMHRYRVTRGPIEEDPSSVHFGSPQYYDLHPSISTDASGSKRVHADRVLAFMSNDLPPDSRRRSLDNWGDSVFQRTIEALTDYQIAHRSAMSLVHDFSQPIWGIPGLYEKVAAKRESDIANVFAAKHFIAGNTNVILKDNDIGGGIGETFERLTTSVSGLPDLLDRASIRLSAARGMPMTKLFGMPPKGFSNEDKSSEADWNSYVKSYQEDNAIPGLTRLVGYLFRQREWSGSGNVPRAFEIEASPLQMPTPIEEATLRKLIAETDAIYIDRQVISPDETADSRFTSEGYSTETTLDRESRESFSEAALESAEAASEPMEIASDPSPDENEEPPLSGQLKDVRETLVAVRDGSIPPDSAIPLMRLAFGISEDDARLLIGPIVIEMEAAAAENEAQKKDIPPEMQAQMSDPTPEEVKNAAPEEEDEGSDEEQDQGNNEGGEASDDDEGGSEADED